MNEVIRKTHKINGLYIDVVYSPDDEGWYWQDGDTTGFGVWSDEIEAIADFRLFLRKHPNYNYQNSETAENQ